MPIKKAAYKALRQSKKRHVRNLKQKDQIAKTIKAIKKAIQNNNKTEALKLIAAGYKALDKAAKKGMIHKNQAARKKSRLTKKINQIGK